MKYQARNITEYAVMCGCGEHGPWGVSHQEARSLAEEEGWLVMDGEIYCPRCRYRREVQDILERNSLLREAYQYAMSLPGDVHKVRGAAEIDGLPRFVMYYLYLSRSEVVDHRLPCGVVAYDVREPEYGLFPELKRWGRAVALWEENGRVEYRVGWSVHEAVYGE